MKKTVQRHSLLVRCNHWIVAISGIILLVSGVGQIPICRSHLVAVLHGLGWSGNAEIILQSHYVFSVIFVGGIVFHVICNLGGQGSEIIPQRGDFQGVLCRVLDIPGNNEEVLQGKYRIRQRLAYLAGGVTSLVLIVTGTVKSYGNLDPKDIDPALLQISRVTHDAAALIFLLFLLCHIAILLMKNHRPLITSMITGKISSDYVRRRHSEWELD